MPRPSAAAPAPPLQPVEPRPVSRTSIHITLPSARRRRDSSSPLPVKPTEIVAVAASSVSAVVPAAPASPPLTLPRAWLSWREFALFRGARRFFNERAAHAHRSSAIHSAIGAWRQRSRELRRRRIALEQADSRSEERIVRTALHEWQCALRERDQEHDADAHHLHRCMAVHMLALRSFVAAWRLRSSAAVHDFRLQSRARPAIVGWQLHALQRKDLRRRGRVATAIALRRQLKTAWTAWREEFVVCTKQRGAMMRVVDTWRKRVELSQRLRAFQEDCSVRLKQDLIDSWFSRLLGVRRITSRARAFHRSLIARRAETVFFLWREHLQRKKEFKRRMLVRWRNVLVLKRRAEHITFALQAFDAHRALREWRQRFTEETRVERAVATIRKQRMSVTKLAVLSEWCRLAATSRALGVLGSTVASVVDRLAMRQALHQIRFVNSRERLLEDLEQRAARKRRQRSLHRAVGIWLGRSEDHQKRGATQHALNRTVRRYRQFVCLQDWKLGLARRKNEAHKAALITRKHAGAVIAAFWARWHAAMYSQSFLTYTERAIVHARRSHALRRWSKFTLFRTSYKKALRISEHSYAQRLCQQALLQWRRSYKLRRYKLAAIAWISVRFEQQQMKQALHERWIHFTAARAKEARIDRHLARIERTCLLGQSARVFRYWHQLTAWVVLQRIRLERTVQSVWKTKQQKALHVWLRRSQDGLLLRARLSSIADRAQRTQQLGTWTAWRSAFIDRRGAQEALRRVVRRWSHRALHRLSLASNFRAVSSTHAALIKFSVLRGWMTLARRWKETVQREHEVIQERQRAVRHQTIRAWARIVRSKRLRSEELARAASLTVRRRFLRLASSSFRLWRLDFNVLRLTEWAQSRQRARLVQGAFELWNQALHCSQRLTRLGSSLDARLARSRKRTFFSRWQTLFQSRRLDAGLLQARLTVRIHHSRLIGALQTWRSRVARRTKHLRQEEQAHLFQQRRSVARAVANWRRGIIRREVLAHEAPEFAHEIQHRRLNIIWSGWRLHVLSEQFRADHAFDPRARFIMHVLSLVQARRDRAELRSHQQEEAAEFHRAIRLRSCFSSWTHAFTTMRKAREFEQRSTLTRLVSSWRLRVERRKAARVSWVQLLHRSRKAVAASHARLLFDSDILRTRVVIWSSLGHRGVLAFRRRAIQYVAASSPGSTGARAVLSVIFQSWAAIRSDRRKESMALTWARSQRLKSVMRTWSVFSRAEKLKWRALKAQVEAEAAAAKAAAAAAEEPEVSIEELLSSTLSSSGASLSDSSHLPLESTSADSTAVAVFAGRSLRRALDSWMDFVSVRRVQRMQRDLAQQARACFLMRSTFCGWTDAFEARVEAERARIAHEEQMRADVAAAAEAAADSAGRLTPPSSASASLPLRSAATLQDVLADFPSPLNASLASQSSQSQSQQRFFPSDSTQQPQQPPPHPATLSFLARDASSPSSLAASSSSAASMHLRPPSLHTHGAASMDLATLAALSPSSLLGSLSRSPRATVGRSSSSEDAAALSFSSDAADADSTLDRSLQLERMAEDVHVCFLLRRTFYRWVTRYDVAQQQRRSQ